MTLFGTNLINEYRTNRNYLENVNKNKQYISDALTFREWLQANKYWVHLLKQDDTVILTYGRILSNGPEKAIASRTYYMYQGEVVWNTVGHV